MAKGQIAVAELITNIILGKTDGASRVDFFPQKPKFPFDKPYEQGNLCIHYPPVAVPVKDDLQRCS